jgi:hypothetical protein
MRYLLFVPIATLFAISVSAQQKNYNKFIPVVSVGSRNTLSVFNSDEAIGKGIGAQFRVQFGKRLNSEWYLDYISSKSAPTARNDYHIGWSLLFYLRNNYDFNRLLQPYLIAGHCFDKTQVFELGNKSNQASRLSMATQAGLGTHINITPKFDCSLSGQYMLHFGKEIETDLGGDQPIIQKADHTHMDGHLLFTVSFNYKLFML